MELYRTCGILDENAYREIGRFIVSRWRVLLMRIYSVILVLLALLMLCSLAYHYAILFLAFSVLFALGPMLLRKLHIRSALKLIHETYPEGHIRMESFFTEEGLRLHNLSSGAQVTLPYGAICLAAETEHYFFLRTKANQFALVFQDDLTEGQRESFLPFLKERCPGLKVIR